jgi:16S rRNA A1518/A1519 N6-dimethyltransferase RsmA/KsgA/DIM1 with predicted DNA glycosylase/AP lyase activity
MNMIHKKADVRYHHEVSPYLQIATQMEFQTKNTSKEIYQYCFKRRERTIQKNAKEIVSNVSKEEGFTVVVEDEQTRYSQIPIKECSLANYVRQYSYAFSCCLLDM